MESQHEFAVSFEIDGEHLFPEVSGLTFIPRVGDIVRCDYLQGQKVVFQVSRVDHHLSNIGHDLFQQVTVIGTRL